MKIVCVTCVCNEDNPSQIPWMMCCMLTFCSFFFRLKMIVSGVDDFIAPEIQQAVILQGNSSTADIVQPSCDIWAFGVMLYKALHRTIHRRDVSLTFANESSIHLNLNDFPGDVAPLLYSCLTLNPALRPDARSVSCDMYFSYSIMGNLLSSGRVLSEENSARISRLLERGRNMSLNTSRCTDLRVNRFRLVDDVLEQLASGRVFLVLCTRFFVREMFLLSLLFRDGYYSRIVISYSFNR